MWTGGLVDYSSLELPSIMQSQSGHLMTILCAIVGPCEPTG
jgi:hypothetical protein